MITSEKDFNPTGRQIELVELVFISRAFDDTVKPVLDQITADILATGHYHYSNYYYNSVTGDSLRNRGFDLPEDRVLRNVADLCMMDGIDTPDKPGTDASRYFRELRRQAKLKGFRDAENAEAIASNKVVQYENELLVETMNIHGIDPTSLYYENRKKLLEILLKMFAPFVSVTEAKNRAYYDKRMMPPKVAEKLIVLKDNDDKVMAHCNNWHDANLVARAMIGRHSDVYYNIAFADDLRLTGSIDLEPRSFWDGIEDVVTWHLRTFHTNVSKSQKPQITQEHRDFSANLLANYNLEE